jgi:hypothetical protein
MVSYYMIENKQTILKLLIFSLPETESEASFVCNSCKTGSFNCFSCQNQIDNSPEADASQALTECSDKNCGRQFHLTCLQNLKNVVFNEKEKSYKCSHHICHTCATKADSLKSNEHYHNKVSYLKFKLENTYLRISVLKHRWPK